MNRLVVLVALLVLVPAVALAEAPPLTLRHAIIEALSASPRLRAPDEGRTLAGIRERQASARFGVKATPSFNTNSDPAGFDQRTLGIGLSKRLPIGTAFQFTATTIQYGTGGSELRDAGYCTPLECSGEDAVYISRLRNDPTVKHGLNMWIVSDNLRKGAALNTIQIAECLINRGLLKKAA